MPRSVQLANVGDKLPKDEIVLSIQSADELNLRLISHWHDLTSVVIEEHEPPNLLTSNMFDLCWLDEVQHKMASSILHQIPKNRLSI
jgi:hypothetical protein